MMIKRMTAAALCALLGGCVIAVGSSDASGMRGVDTKRFEVAGFDAVELVGTDDVRVVRSDAVSVVATGDPRAVAALSVTVDRNTLRIARRPGRWQDRGAVVTVTVPALRAATLSGSGDIEVEAAAPDFDARLTGSGTLSLRDLHSRRVRIALDGSGDVVATGIATRADIRLGGSGDVEARALATQELYVDAAGSGDVDAQATITADVSATGTGDVSIIGPARCSVRKGGTGDVRCG